MNDIFEIIKKNKKILVMAHENPDGDAIGSAMAFYHMLTDMKKDVTILVPEMPETFLYLDGINEVVTESNDKFDLVIVVDCANKERLGQTNDEFSRCKSSLVIDHHASNTEYGNINYVEEDTASCCQVIYYLFKNWNLKLTKEICEALVTGMLTDTAGFRNNNVDKNTYLMASELMDMGIDIHRIYYLAISKRTMPQYLLVKMTLDRLEIFDDGRIAFSYISEEDMENVGAKLGDHEGLVDLGRNIGGVEASIFMRECGDVYRISLRSNGKVNVNKVAQKFGGGGHKMAAGIKTTGNFKETKEALISAIKEELDK